MHVHVCTYSYAHMFVVGGGFRDGERHTLTPKPALIFNWIGTIKRPFTLHACREKQK